MMKNCIICGTELVDGKCPNTHGVKPMCLNCKYVQFIDGKEYCINENVLKTAYDKMMAALPEGFEAELTIKPMALKNSCKKCGNYDMDSALVIDKVLSDLGLAPLNVKQ